MPTLNRVDWALRQLAMQRRMRITFGQAQLESKVKINIFLDPVMEQVASPATQAALQSVLGVVRMMVGQYVATDRGHKHSNGQSVVQIWVEIPRPQATAADAVMHGTSSMGKGSSLNPNATAFCPVGSDEAESSHGQNAGVSSIPGAPYSDLQGVRAHLEDVITSKNDLQDQYAENAENVRRPQDQISSGFEEAEEDIKLAMPGKFSHTPAVHESLASIDACTMNAIIAAQDTGLPQSIIRKLEQLLVDTKDVAEDVAEVSAPWS